MLSAADLYTPDDHPVPPRVIPAMDKASLDYPAVIAITDSARVARSDGQAGVLRQFGRWLAHAAYRAPDAAAFWLFSAVVFWVVVVFAVIAVS